MVLGAWFWQHFGNRIVEPYDRRLISPASYDVTLGEHVIFYRFRGVDYPGLPARLIEDKNGPTLHFNIPGFFPAKTVARVDAGDIFLAETEQYFKQPRGVSLVFMLKSSVARGFLEHLHAGWGEHGFHGKYTLEFEAQTAGVLQVGRPIGQMVAHATFGLYSYADKGRRHYQNQQGVTPNKNRKTAWVPWWNDEALYREWLEKNELDADLEPETAALRKLRRDVISDLVNGF